MDNDHRHICKRAVLALFLRVAVLLIDIAILGLSVPHSIDVYESDVRSTVLAISDIQVPTASINVPQVWTDGYYSPCKPDLIEYNGFKATA